MFLGPAAVPWRSCYDMRYRFHCMLCSWRLVPGRICDGIVRVVWRAIRRWRMLRRIAVVWGNESCRDGVACESGTRYANYWLQGLEWWTIAKVSELIQKERQITTGSTNLDSPGFSRSRDWPEMHILSMVLNRFAKMRLRCPTSPSLRHYSQI